MSPKPDFHFPAIKSESLKAEILNIFKTYVVIPAYEWDVTGLMKSMPQRGHGWINHTDSQSI